MKALKYFIILAVVALSAACEDDVERELSPEQNPNSTNVYFSKDNVSAVVLPLESTSFDVIVSREVSASEQTVSLSAENVRSDLFSIPESVTFAAGESQKSISVEVNEDIVLMESYHLAIVIDQEQTKPYVQQDVYPRIELTVTKEDFAPYADGTYTSVFFENSTEATLQYSPATSQYRFKDCWETGYNYIFKVAEDGTITQVPETTETGVVDSKYGMISATAQSGSSFDSATNTYTFVIKWTVSAGSFGVYNDTFEITNKY